MTVDEALANISRMTDMRRGPTEEEMILSSEVERLSAVKNQYHMDRVEWRRRAESAEDEAERLRRISDNNAMGTLDYGVCKASLAQARAQRDAFRNALERIEDDDDCVDMEECKYVAREALER